MENADESRIVPVCVIRIEIMIYDSKCYNVLHSSSEVLTLPRNDKSLFNMI